MSPENYEKNKIQEDNVTELPENKIADETQTELYNEETEINKGIETDGKPKNNPSKIFLYVIYAIVIFLCLFVIARNLLFNQNNNNKHVSSSTSSVSSLKDPPKKIMDLYILADLPDSYKLSKQDISETKAVSIYKNKKTEIVLTQSTINGYKPEYDVNDKDIVISNFYNGAGQDYKAYQIDGKCYIVWTTDEYTFEIKTSLKKSESIPFVINVQKADDVSSSKPD